MKKATGKPIRQNEFFLRIKGTEMEDKGTTNYKCC
jgi:hypothetical protein